MRSLAEVEETVAIRQASETADMTEHAHSQSGLQDEERGITRTGEYKLYKRRFLGLIQLVLLNIVVSWDVCRHSPQVHTMSNATNCSIVVDLFCDFDDLRSVFPGF